MKNLLSILTLFLCIAANAQNDFKTAAQAFENNEFEKTLGILSQLEAKMGANPKLESLRAFTYDQSGDKQKAYASVLKYFKLAGRNNINLANKELENLELSLKSFFENDFKQKQQQLETLRSDNANTVVAQKASVQNKQATEKQSKYDNYYETKIKNTKVEFTPAEIKFIKENIKTKSAETLNENTLKINVLKFSDDLYIGQDEDVIVDRLYDEVVKVLKTESYYIDAIKKERRVKFKKESDYHQYLTGFKDDLRLLLRAENYNAKKDEANRIDTKYLVSTHSLKLPCYLVTAAPYAGDKKGEVNPHDLYTKDKKVSSLGGMVYLSGASLKYDFTNSSGLNLRNADDITNKLKSIYGSVNLKIEKSTEQERNFAKYFYYNYKYSIKTNTFKYDLEYGFGPYGYENGNRDVITGSVLRYVAFSITKL